MIVQGAGNANVLAGGISEALDPPHTLCVAIPAISSCSRYFNQSNR